MKLLIIENNEEDLNLLEKFFVELEINHIIYVKKITALVEEIEKNSPDIVICNPYILSEKQIDEISFYIRNRNILILWYISSQKRGRRLFSYINI